MKRTSRSPTNFMMSICENSNARRAGTRANGSKGRKNGVEAEETEGGSMAKKFSDLVNRTMSAESQERARRKTEKMLGELALDELRAALSLTQEAVAETLGVKQSSVSKILHGQDMYLSTLDKILRAMGGELEVYVALPDGRVRLSLDQFRIVAKQAEHQSRDKRSQRAAVAVSI